MNIGNKPDGSASREREQQFIRCCRGVFTLPPEIFDAFRDSAPSGIIFFRQDEDVLTISTERLAGSRRKQLHHTYKSAPFRSATRLAVVNFADTVQLMPVEWRKVRLAATDPALPIQ